MIATASPGFEVRLVNTFNRPYDNAIATELDESFNGGALHELKIALAGGEGDEVEGHFGATRKHVVADAHPSTRGLGHALQGRSGSREFATRGARQLDPGFEAEGLVVARFNPRLQGYDAGRTAAFYQELRERLAALPGTRELTEASHLPLTLNVSFESVAEEGTSEDVRAAWVDAETGNEAIPAMWHRTCLYDAAFDPGGSKIVTCTASGAVRVWDLSTDAVAAPPGREETYSPNGE